MPRRFVYDLDVRSGLIVSPPLLGALAADDLPRVPGVAGGYTSANVVVDQYGRVTSASSGTGLSPLSPDPSGSYTNLTATVNDKGQVTAASSGSGGSTPILEQVWAYLAANNSDPIDTLITSGNYVVFVYLASQNANAWKDATNAVHTVGVGKTLTVLHRFSVGASADTARDGRLQNTTDATTVDSVNTDGRFGSAIPWVGDLATASKLPTVAAGKTVKAGIWNSDTNKRAFGVVYVCDER